MTEDCILWEGAVQSKGYGTATVEGKRLYVHRLAWQKENGLIPKGKIVMHKCDVRLCINPDHLRVGTIADNQRDMQEKGRGRNQFSGITECLRGHKYTPENTRTYRNRTRWSRQCLTCMRMRRRKN